MQVDSTRIQIRFISRPKHHANSRAILNEDELVDELRRRYVDHADVAMVQFNGSLSSAMLAMNETDILIGAHGAGAIHYPVPALLLSVLKITISIQTKLERQCILLSSLGSAVCIAKIVSNEQQQTNTRSTHPFHCTVKVS